MKNYTLYYLILILVSSISFSGVLSEKELLESKKKMLGYYHGRHNRQAERIKEDLIKKGYPDDKLEIDHIKADVAESCSKELENLERRRIRSYIMGLKRQYGIEYDDLAAFYPKRPDFEKNLDDYCNAKETVGTGTDDFTRYERLLKKNPHRDEIVRLEKERQERARYNNEYYNVLIEIPFSMDEINLMQERFISSPVDVKSKLLKLFEQEWSLSSETFLWTYLEDNVSEPIRVEVLKTLKAREQLDVDKIKNVISKAREANDTLLEEEAFSFLAQENRYFNRMAARTLAEYLSDASPENVGLILKYYEFRFDDNSVKVFFKMLNDPRYDKFHYRIGSILGDLSDSHSGRINVWSQMLEYLNADLNKHAALGFIEELDIERVSFPGQKEQKEAVVEQLVQLSAVYNDAEVKSLVQEKIADFKSRQMQADEKEYERGIAFLKGYLKMIELSLLDKRVEYVEEADKAYDQVIEQCQTQLTELKTKYPQEGFYGSIEEELAELIRMRQLSKSEQARQADSEFNRFKEQVRKKYDEPVRLISADSPDGIGVITDGKKIAIEGHWEAWTADVLERVEHYFENGKLHVKIYVKPYFNTRGEFYGSPGFYVSFPKIDIPQEVIVVGPRHNSTLTVRRKNKELCIPNHALVVESRLVQNDSSLK